MSNRKAKKFLSEAEISEVRALYIDGTSAAELAEAYGVAKSTVFRMCKDLPRNKKKTRVIIESDAPEAADPQADDVAAIAPPPAAEETKICPHCGEVLPARARFCMMCGKVPKTERELLIERVEKLTGAFRFMPESQRDEAIATLNATLTFLRNAG